VSPPPGESWNRGPWLFGLITVAAVAAIAYGAIVRNSMLIAELRYVPAESQVVIMTGSLGKLWAAIDDQFGAVLRATERRGPMALGLASLQDAFKEHELPINSLADLGARGIDVNAGLIVAVEQVSDFSSGGPAYVAIIHTTSSPKLIHTLAKVMEATVSGPRKEADFNFPLTILQHEQEQEKVFAATPSPGIVVLSNNRDFLRRSIGRQAQNLTHLRSDDEFYAELRQHRGWKAFAGPDLFVFCRPLSLRPALNVSGLLRFLDDEVVLRADLNLSTAVIKSVDDLFLRSNGDLLWPKYLPRETAAAVSIQSPSASHYLPLLATELNVHEVAPHWVPVLARLADVEDLHQLVVALPRYREGSPDLQVGIWAGADSLSKLLSALRLNLQDERDRTVLDAAATQYCAANGTSVPACSPGVQQLIDAAWLEAEHRPRFLRFSIVGGHSKAPPGNDPQEAPRAANEPAFLVAPINGNDRRYRPELANADAAALQGDRYRFAYLFKNGVLWIATSPGDLAVMRTDSLDVAASRLSESAAFRKSTSRWKSRSRVWGYMNIDRLLAIEHSQPAAGDSSDAATELDELRLHPAFSVELTPLADGHRIHVVAHLLRWKAVPAQ
jgi:hypothetical protein